MGRATGHPVGDVGDDGSGTSGTWSCSIIRGLVGVVLLTAGLLKGYELATGPVAGQGILASRGVLIGLVEFELVFGLWLLSGLYPQATRWVAVGCFTVFGSVTMVRALAGETSCGCFGRVTVSPWLTLAFDVAAMVLLLRLRQTTASAPTIQTHPSRAVGFLMGAVLVGTPTAVAMARPYLTTRTAQDSLLGERDFTILKPETWVGERFPLLDYIDIGDKLASGHWTVVLYHHDCPSCQEAIPKYEQRAHAARDQPGAQRIALVEMPPYVRPGRELVASDSSCVSGRLDDSRTWFATTPLEIILNDAIVQYSDGFLNAKIETTSYE